VRVATIIAVALLAAAPAILHGLPPGHDHALHLTWYTHFAAQLWDGDPRPRWLFTMNAGFGSPTFFFYGPTPYYISSAFRPLFRASPSFADPTSDEFSSRDPVGWRQLGLSAALALVLSGIGAFLWLREALRARADARSPLAAGALDDSESPRTTGAPDDRRAARAAFCGAIAYTILPYHVAADLYTRAAFAEFWALAWIPWVLFFAKQRAAGAVGARRDRAALVGLALATALLVTTHPPTALIFLGVPVLEAILVSPTGRRTIAARRLLAGVLLGAALSAAYWLPALANQDEVRTRVPATDPRHYARNFLFDAAPDRSFADFARALEAITGLTALAALAALPAARIAAPRAAILWAGVALASVALMSPLSHPIWGLLPALQTIQFPWRFNIVLAVAAAATCALAAGAAPGRGARAGRVARAAPIFVLVAVSIFLDWKAIRDGAVTRHALEPSLSLMTVAAGMDNQDLRPRTARFEMFEGASLATLAARAERAHVVSGSGSAGIAGWGPRDIHVRTDSPDEILVVLDQLYFPGWRARLVPTGERIDVSPDPQWGLAMLRVPAGRREVVLTPTGGVSDLWGAALSALAALTLVAILVRGARAPRVTRQGIAR